MTRLALLCLPLAFGPGGADSSPLAPLVRTFDLPSLTSAEATRLQGKPALFRVVVDSDTGETDEGAVMFDCSSPNEVARSVRLAPRQELPEGADTVLVEGTLRVLTHAPVKGSDGSYLPALVEYRLTAATMRQPYGRPPYSLQPAPIAALPSPNSCRGLPS